MKQSKSITSNSLKVKAESRRKTSKQSPTIIETATDCDDPENFQKYFPQICAINKTKSKFNIITVSFSNTYLAQGVLDLSDIREPEAKKKVQTQKGKQEYVESGNIERQKDEIKDTVLPDDPGKPTNVVAITSKIDKKSVISNLIFKDVGVESIAVNALDVSLEKQKNLESLKFINCNLGANEIISMKNMLSKYSNITELYIDRNPFNADNMGLLLDETSSLKFLTLRLCQINDNCVKGIAEQLQRVESTLQVLNLSSNYITDLGCEYITNALRMNRSLIVLNLSNNFLTDQSCVYFRLALVRFELTPKEIKMKRREHFNRLFLRRSLVQKYTQISIDQLDIKSQRGKSPKRRSAGASVKSNTKTNDSEREKFINANMPKLTHPFIVDVELKDGAIFCHGNFQLAHLNIAFNKITNSGLKVLHNILSYQVNHMNQIGFVGLVALIFDGNPISYDLMYELIGEMNDLLELKNRATSK